MLSLTIWPVLRNIDGLSQLKITRQNGTTTIALEMNDETFQALETISRDRGIGVAEVVAEALRLERVFADSRLPERDNKLYMHQNGRLREIVAV